MTVLKAAIAEQVLNHSRMLIVADATVAVGHQYQPQFLTAGERQLDSSATTRTHLAALHSLKRAHMAPLVYHVVVAGHPSIDSSRLQSPKLEGEHGSNSCMMTTTMSMTMNVLVMAMRVGGGI